MDVVATCVAWNTKNVKPAQVPHTWAELWDLKRFSGQRGMWKQPYQVMEIALMADGVPLDKLYPLDVDRALKSLDRIKPEIFWWTSGARSGADPDRWRCRRRSMAWNGRLFDPKQSGAARRFRFQPGSVRFGCVNCTARCEEQDGIDGIHRFLDGTAAAG